MGQKRVHFLHTNDLHSHLDQFGKIYTLVESLRSQFEADGEPCFLLDIGDHMDRFRLETEGTDGRVNRALLERTGYDMVTFGNNELLTFSKEQLGILYHDVPFSVVSTNVFDLKGDHQPDWIVPYQWKVVNGIRCCFLAATIPYPLVYEMMGWQVKNPFPIIEEAVLSVRHQADVVVLLSHLGLDKDQLLAEKIDGIDVIIGAHTHHLFEQAEKIGNTYLTAAGKFGQAVGQISITVDPDRRSIEDVSACCHFVEQHPSAESIEDLMDWYKLQAEQNMSQPVTWLEEPLEINWNEESPFANLLADSIRDWVGSDLALVNSGQLLCDLPRGTITQRIIHQACPHPINPVLMEISGRDLKDTLEESLLNEFKQKPIRGFGFRGKILGMMSVSGIEVRYDPDREPFQKITSLWLGEKEWKENEKYLVGMIDMFMFGAGYLRLRSGKLIKYFLPEFLRDLLAHQLKKPTAIRKCRQRRFLTG
ncbi:bifunctional metallophosphatase/5'-nucleotidase [Thermoactinomyces mirandus]|uniref:Bifunctional metallophosphatase/5'-nucleotidase n=1 Tax=Thermoactinomyces mirandus TaxID=2756294 RepID=A0A7W1XV46_9BACL|nr:bifunctional UDP-sugar hydrolase/5'-nucleotidase [Thermoactinomyces mirandus]MBA4603763.1 bifunctional metallophosphatase/5'-nucleotidase [Thermoactinomyces mirandus]